MTTQAQTTVKTYDCITTCSGALFRPRRVTSANGKFDEYMAGSIAGKDGVLDKARNTFPGTISYDVKVVGGQAKRVFEQVILPYVSQYKAQQGDMNKIGIYASYVLGGVKGEAFVYQNGAKKGQTGVVNKGVLLRFKYLSIAGQEIDLSPFDPVEESTPANKQAAQPRNTSAQPEAPAEPVPNNPDVDIAPAASQPVVQSIQSGGYIPNNTVVQPTAFSPLTAVTYSMGIG